MSMTSKQWEDDHLPPAQEKEPLLKPPSTTSLMLERMRMLETATEEVAAAVRVNHTREVLEMGAIREHLISMDKALWYILFLLPPFAFLLGAVLVAVLLK